MESDGIARNPPRPYVKEIFFFFFFFAELPNLVDFMGLTKENPDTVSFWFRAKTSESNELSPTVKQDVSSELLQENSDFLLMRFLCVHRRFFFKYVIC